MTKVVLDASALVALVNEENGHKFVEAHLANSLMSVVNLSEVAAILAQVGLAMSEVRELANSLVSEFVEFDMEQAYFAAHLRSTTKEYGLSFGDRACIGLAHRLHLPVLTADRAWMKLKIGVEVRLIR